MSQRIHPLTDTATTVALQCIPGRFGEAEIVSVEPLGHDYAPVSRILLRTGNSQHSVVVKTIRTAEPGYGDLTYLRREIAAHQLAANHNIGAALLGHNLDHGVAVFADLGNTPTLEQALLTPDAPRPAEQAFIALAETMGRLHAVTRTSEASYQDMLSAGGASDDDRSWSGFELGGSDWNQLAIITRTLELPEPTAVEPDIDALFDQLRHPQTRALLHGDSNPGNIMTTPDGSVRLVDFETSHYGHIGLDLAQLDYPFPYYSAHVSTLPAALIDDAIAAYRDHISTEWRSDLHCHRVVGAANALLVRLLRLPVVVPDDQPPEKRWRRRAQLIAQIDRYLAIDNSGLFPEIAGWLHRLRHHLTRRWPDATTPIIEHFPAFGGPLRPTV